MKRIALAALFASLSMAAAAPALADEYDDAVTAQVGKFLTYPQAAVNLQVEGRVGVKLDVDAQGHVTKITLDNRSRNGVLDRATLSAVRRAANTVQAGTGEAHTLHLFVTYTLI